ncbi:uncharacterized protein LOC126192219 [Schistocerca nitens]|uniref:uncharacterized protein LOC126192219 n=1 Tax=Schistocerca nitens TaxID=7011 RepID=UPI0021198083|nr:uncharacterized protein LOC126192219 [Schistocerca nitens]
MAATVSSARHPLSQLGLPLPVASTVLVVLVALSVLIFSEAATVGCRHEGVTVPEGGVVATAEPCLSCRCSSGSLQCRLQVCPRMPQPQQLPPGCRLQLQPGKCCPQLVCGCTVGGQQYTEGVRIEVDRAQCKQCYCIRGRVQCTTLKCSPPIHGCTPVISNISCCPTRYECNRRDEERATGTTRASSIEGTISSVGKKKNKIFERVPLQNYSTTTNNANRSPGTQERIHREMGPIDMENKIVSNNGTQNSTANNTTTEEVETTTSDIQNATTLNFTSEENVTPTIMTETIPAFTEPENTTENLIQNETTVANIITAMERIDNLSPEDNKTENVTSNEITTEVTDDIITLQTESTFLTIIPTTIIMPEELDTVNVTVHTNVSISEPGTNNTSLLNNSAPSERVIPPEIEAIINITQKKDPDYDEYDYNVPSLPPSLPGVRIIPFVAADAVLENKGSPTVYPKPGKQRPTDNPVFYKVSHPNLFSPPIETEGGFIPQVSNLDGPFYESKYDIPYHTTGINIPESHIQLDITTGTIIPPSITILPKPENERCLSDGHEYRHGAVVPGGTRCSTCACYFGEILCQLSPAAACPPPPPGCRTTPTATHLDLNTCCPRVLCGDMSSPTTAVDIPQLPAPPIKPNIIPGVTRKPVTVASGVVTPDPFRDVIRTEPAPDLPALIGDMMLLDLRTSTTPMPIITSEAPATDKSSEQHETSSPRSNITLEKLPFLLTGPGPVNDSSKNDTEMKDEDDSSHLFDSVLQFLFPVDSPNVSTKMSPNMFNTSKPPSLITISKNHSNINTMNLNNLHNVSDSSEMSAVFITDSSTHKREKNENDKDMLTTLPNGSLTTTDQPQILSADPGAASGLLKLAGCNIYGRMYRVGRIISELSGPCLECMCTEVGVQCRPLDC